MLVKHNFSRKVTLCPTAVNGLTWAQARRDSVFPVLCVIFPSRPTGASGDQSKMVTEYGSTSMKASMTLGPPRESPQWMASSNCWTFPALRQGTPK